MARAKAKSPETNEPNVVGAQRIVVTPIRLQTLEVRIIGTSPYMMSAMSGRSLGKMRAKMEAGEAAKKGQKRDKRDFDADCQAALHLSTQGWVGMPASAFRSACIDACRVTGYKMVMAKMSIFIKADGWDQLTGQPLVKINGSWVKTEMPARNANMSLDIRARPQWKEWFVDLCVEFDGDQFTPTDVINLIERAGIQVGVGEGRPLSRNSNGMGMGTFRVAREDELKIAKPRKQA